MAATQNKVSFNYYPVGSGHAVRPPSISAKTGVEHMTRNLTELDQRIRQVTQQCPFAVHWQVRDIATGQHIGHEDRQVLGSFSTRKVSILLACLALVREDKLSLEDSFVITEELKDGVQAGIMRNLSAGIALSLHDHLAQMMITSDNICTQLVFQAIEDATGNALQWVNDYCAQVGMFDTLHREVFPRSGDLEWHHSIEGMTVTSAHDQALLLERLARGYCDEAAAIELGLTQELCKFVIELMGHIYTPLLGAHLTKGRFVEKNGRGIRGLSQVGLLLDEDDVPVASVAIFAESIPVQLLDRTPGRNSAREMFMDVGQLLEAFYLGGSFEPVARPEAVPPDYWEQECGELLCDVEDGRAVNESMVFTFSGIGKLFLAYTLNELGHQRPELLREMLQITAQHRALADTGTLRHLTGDVQVSLDDAVRLMIGSGDGAATRAILDHLEAAGIDILESARRSFAHLESTTITGLENRSAGDGLTGTTTGADVRALLREIIDANGTVLEWMSATFEPAGLASALPGYGPHTVEHWTVSDWSGLESLYPDEGRTSVLILQCPRGKGPVGMVSHAPAGTQQVSAKFGSVGLSTYAYEQFAN